MRKLLGNSHGNSDAITAILGFLIVLGISVLVFFNIMGTIDTTDIDSNFGGVNTTPAANATGEVLDQSAVFFQIAPILAIVIIAVVIIAYVKKV